MATWEMCDDSVRHKGSNNTPLHKCDPCKFEETEIEATAFCNTCKEFLCTDCLRSHRKSRASRSHEIIESDDPSTVGNLSTNTVGEELCEIHQHSVLKYCRTHDANLCDICWTIDHNTCEDVVNIHEICEQEAGRTQTSSYLANIRSLIGKLKILEKEKVNDKDEPRKQKQKCVNQIQNLRREINSLLDKLETRLYKEIDEEVKKESRAIEDQISKIQLTLQALEIGASDIEKASKIGAFNTFVAMKKINLRNAENVHNTIENEKYRISLQFHPDDILNKLLKNLKEFGELRTERNLSETTRVSSLMTIYHPLPNRMTADLVDKNLLKVGDYRAKNLFDFVACDIWGSHFLTNGDLLLCDRTHEQVKLLAHTFTVQSSIKLSSKPWDVTLVTDMEAAVTVPYEHTIYFLTIGRSLKLLKGRSIRTEKRCRGIAFHKNQLYVTCNTGHGNSEIIVLNLQGQVDIKVPNTDHFELPYHIAVDNESRIYVSDWDTSILTCMTRTGLTMYTSNRAETGVNKPTGLLVDDKQNVYLCGSGSNNISVVNAAGKKYKELVNENGGLNRPRTMAYRSYDKTLVVGMLDGIVCYRFCVMNF